MNPWALVITDIVTTLLLLFLYIESKRLYVEYRHDGILHFAIFFGILLFAPITRLIAFFSPTRELSQLFFRIQLILADVSVIFFIVALLIAINGNVDWRILSIISGFVFLCVQDILLYPLPVFREHNLWNYVSEASPLGAFLTSILVSISLVVFLYYMIKLQKAIIHKTGKKWKSIQICTYGGSFGILMIFLGYFIDAFFRGFAQLVGPLGVIILSGAIIIAARVYPYILMMIPHRIDGFVAFTESGLILSYKYYVVPQYTPQLLVGILSAVIAILEGEGDTKSGHISVGFLNIALAKKKERNSRSNC